MGMAHVYGVRRELCFFSRHSGNPCFQSYSHPDLKTLSFPWSASYYHLPICFQVLKPLFCSLLFSVDPWLLSNGGNRYSMCSTGHFFSFLWPHPWHTEVTRLGVRLELQLLAYTKAPETLDLSHICNLHHSLW